MIELKNADDITLQAKIQKLEQRIQILEQRNVNVNALDELGTDDMGDMRAGRFLALLSGSNPTDPDANGSFMSAAGETFGSWLIKVGEVLNGQLQAGFGGGALVWAGGDGIGDASGLNLNGIRYALKHYATDPDGNNARFGRFEMFYEDGKTIPGLALTFMDGATGTNLVTNGNFETGNLTNWTLGTHQSPGPVIAAAAAYPGTSYGIDCTWTIPASSGYLHNIIDSDRCTVGSLLNYTLTFSRRKVQDVLDGIKHISSLLRCSVYLKWYNAPTGGTLLRTDTIGSTPPAAWGTITYNVKSPAGAASVVVEIDIYSYQAYDFQGRYSTGTAEEYFDEVTLTQILFSRKLLFGPDPSIYDGSITRKILGGVKELPLPLAQTISLVTTASGNCDNGAHTCKITVVDADGETLPSAVSNSVTVDASHKQITVPLPIGPWGTTGRNVYMCTVADGTTWYLAATISDNTTTTINLSISDANLAAAAAAPGYNTTGSRPLFPRSAHIFAENILGFSANGTPITTFTATNTSSQVRFGFYFTNTSSALGDRYQTNVYLEGGTYTFEIYGIKTTTCGIFDLYVDGVLISAGNDWYSASTVYDQVLDITNVSVIGNGYHLIEMVISGTSHTSYRLPITYISMWKATY